MIRMMIKKPTVADVSLTNPPSRLRLPLWQSPFLGRHCQMEVSGHLRSHESVTFSSFEGKSVSVAGEGSHLRGSTLSLHAQGRWHSLVTVAIWIIIIGNHQAKLMLLKLHAYLSSHVKPFVNYMPSSPSPSPPSSPSSPSSSRLQPRCVDMWPPTAYSWPPTPPSRILPYFINIIIVLVMVVIVIIVTVVYIPIVLLKKIIAIYNQDFHIFFRVRGCSHIM